MTHSKGTVLNLSYEGASVRELLKDTQPSRFCFALNLSFRGTVSILSDLCLIDHQDEITEGVPCS